MSDIDDEYEVFTDILETRTPDEAIRRLRVLRVPPEIIDRILERHESEIIAVRDRNIAPSVVRDNRHTWYTGPRDGDRFWPVLRAGLEKKGWSETSIDALDRSSTQVVSLLNHPKEKEFSARGLVVGHVQSGKTTNFTAVVAKAADRNYKFIIVLAGIHNSLRRQTQLRLENDLVASNRASWMNLTIPDTDFKPPAADAIAYFAKSRNQHVLCVIKKNAAVLRKFRSWLTTASESLKDTPALIIDDEADQATVATKTINPLILDIMNRLPKAAYIGYTATPFANLLIDPAAADLYPQDFIVSLPKPEGHFGTEVLFGREPLDGEDPSDVEDGYDMIREIPDHEVDDVRPASKDDKDGFTPIIAGELRSAILYFWMTTAARRIRGIGNKHSTMLIHTSVNTEIHNSFEGPLREIRHETAERLRRRDPRLTAELAALWARETTRVPAAEFGRHPVLIDEILSEMPAVLDVCRIIFDNASSKVRLDYEGTPVVAIAVGGNTLSRGLTLEGLVVSYFVRSVSAYDTLLQMGRWFGYRIGYEDLPRVWMTSDLRDWFRHIATVEAEIRRDIDVYLGGNETPRTFAVRIRTHPSMQVTAAAKMKDHVKAEIAYGGRRIQTHYFDVSPDVLQANQAATRRLVGRLVSDRLLLETDAKADRFLFSGVANDEIVRFLREYRFHADAHEGDGSALARYIGKRAAQSDLSSWNVAIIGNRLGDESDRFELAPGISPRRVNRARLMKSDVVDIKTLMSLRDAAVDLDLSGETGRLEEERIFKLRDMQAPHTGLLTLYVIDKTSEPAPRNAKSRVPIDAPDHLIGVGVVFPHPTGRDSVVEYDYISADLARLPIEDDDSALLLETEES